MKAVIIDAGKGTRLYPITKCISKGLVPVYDKPCLMYQLYFLASMGIKDIAIVASQKYYDTYKDFLKEIDTDDLSISLYAAKSGTGIVTAYESCTEFVKENDIIVTMGDCLYFVNEPKQLLEQANSCFKNDKVGIVIGKKKPGSHNEFMNYIPNFNLLCGNSDPEEIKKLCAIGIYFIPNTLSGSLSELVQLKFNDSDINLIYEKLLKANRIMLPQYSLDDEWFDIGTPERLFIASAYVREKLYKISH